MKHSSLIAINAASQYIRTIINVVLSLYSTRIILEALGESNYGIYTLVAGVVFLLSFVTNAMATTTQRFLSYHGGEDNLRYRKTIFSNSIILHILLSGCIILLLELSGLFLFDGFLNISSARLPAAKITCQCVILMVVGSCISAPFRGLLISYENIVYISIIDVIDGVIKLAVAFIVLNVHFISDSLIEYSALLICVSIFNLLAFSIYCFSKYPECHNLEIKIWNADIIKRMTSFAGWMIYSTFMIVGRNQGTAIVINRFYGTIVNASFGIAMQINSACQFISGSILTAFNPYIIRSEGLNNHSESMRYAQTASKLCYLMMLLAVLPLCFYMDEVIYLWLGTVPPYSTMFARVILITTLSDQITTGLSVINKAIGKLKIYSLTVDSAKILTVPLIAILLAAGLPLNIAMLGYVLMELTSAILRLPIVKRQQWFDIWQWVSKVIIKLLIPTTITFFSYLALYNLIGKSWGSIIIVIIIGSSILLVTSFYFALSQSERHALSTMFSSVTARFKL